MKFYRILYCLIFFLCGGMVEANNIQVSKVSWDAGSVSADNILKLTFTVSWDNSWRDGYNWDAAYVFLKYRKTVNSSGQVSENEPWHHLWLPEATNNSITSLTEGVTYDYTMATRGSYLNTGMFIYRKSQSNGTSNVEITVNWDIKSNGNLPLSSLDFWNSKVQIVAMGIEMVYIPRGPFRIGDGYSEKSFRKSYTPLPAENDIIGTDPSFIYMSNPSASVFANAHPEYAADRRSDNVNYDESCWWSNIGATLGSDNNPWWAVDFGAKKTIRYFGINASPNTSYYIPTAWRLVARNDLSNPSEEWKTLFTGNATDWVRAYEAYPIEKVLKVAEPGAYRYYEILVDQCGGAFKVKSIGMTEDVVPILEDHSVVIDGTPMTIDSLRYLGARDGDNWASGAIPETYPNGFREFYAMKYELTQEQYVQFLNKLTLQQQSTLLGIEQAEYLKILDEGDYVFGSTNEPTWRNGIMVERKIDGCPVVFACNLNPADRAGSNGDGQTLACNYMNIVDMLAYADWSGLRPLSEMEYEKMARPLYESELYPLSGEFVWNTQSITGPVITADAGKISENVTGNANYGNVIEGPVRVGAFAAAAPGTSPERTGASFWGVMELSGNLSEIYYNANPAGRAFQAYEYDRHGDGVLDATTGKANVSTSYWPQGIDAFAVRGGCFSDGKEMLAASNRKYNKNYFPAITKRDSSVTFRLGRSVLPFPKTAMTTYLTLQNGLTTKNGNAYDTISGLTKEYTIIGNRPVDAKDGEAYTYLWYLLEDNGMWRLLRGENGKDLTYKKFENTVHAKKTYRFKRKTITRNKDHTTNEVFIIMDQSPEMHLNRLRDTIEITGLTKGSFITYTPLASSRFEWYWKKPDGSLKLLQGSPIVVTDNSTYSHFTPVDTCFDGTAGEKTVLVRRWTSGITKCYREVELKVFVDKATSKAVASDAPNFECGQYIVDARDGKIYGTAYIANLCWMTRNLDYREYGSPVAGLNEDAYGRFYTWFQAVGAVDKNGNTIKTPAYDNGRPEGICPSGWVLPDNEDWTYLINNLKEKQAQSKHMRASQYWSYVNQDVIGDNSSGFTAIPAGYVWGSYTGNAYARFWTSEAVAWSTNWYDGWYFTISNDLGIPALGYTWGRNYSWGNNNAGRSSIRCIRDVNEE